jgi:hypothetical protein
MKAVAHRGGAASGRNDEQSIVELEVVVRARLVDARQVGAEHDAARVRRAARRSKYGRAHESPRSTRVATYGGCTLRLCANCTVGAAKLVGSVRLPARRAGAASVTTGAAAGRRTEPAKLLGVP